MKNLRPIIAIALFGSILMIGCKGKVDTCFTFITNGLVVSFNSDCSENAETWEWEFGDGSTSIAANPTHEFPAEGSYSVTLRATGPRESTYTKTQSVVVAEECITCLAVEIETEWILNINEFCGTAQELAEFRFVWEASSNNSYTYTCN